MSIVELNLGGRWYIIYSRSVGGLTKPERSPLVEKLHTFGGSEKKVGYYGLLGFNFHGI